MVVGFEERMKPLRGGIGTWGLVEEKPPHTTYPPPKRIILIYKLFTATDPTSTTQHYPIYRFARDYATFVRA